MGMRMVDLKAALKGPTKVAEKRVWTRDSNWG
jgi:hypothetical protein